jgi:NADH-quinone oxidoreductase subunit A
VVARAEPAFSPTSSASSPSISAPRLAALSSPAASHLPATELPRMLETYLPMFVMFAIVAIISSVMFLGGQFIGPKNPNPEKLSPFECGNDTEGAKNTKLSVKFYLTAILFVVFDIEVVFMYPWATLFKGLGWSGFATMFSFIVALVVALAYCWKKGALEWES